MFLPFQGQRQKHSWDSFLQLLQVQKQLPPSPGLSCCQKKQPGFPSPAFPVDRRPPASWCPETGWQHHTAAIVISVLFLIYSAGTMVVLLAFHMVWSTFCVRSRRALPRKLFPSLPKPLGLELLWQPPLAWMAPLMDTLMDAVSWVSALSKEPPGREEFYFSVS